MRGALLVVLAFAPAACHVRPPPEEMADVYVPAPADDAASDGTAEEAAAPDAAADASPAPVQVDRAGHPLANVVLVPGAHQDDYNGERSFESNFPRVLQEAVESRLEFFDTVAVGDGGPDPIDWPVPEGGTHPLLPMFVTDVLLVDTALPSTAADGGFAASYLDIEREIYLGGAPHETCGGRTPSDDVAGTTLTLIVTGDRDGGPPIAQGTAGPTKAPVLRFPYFADPN
jgi:hypothetical protein